MSRRLTTLCLSLALLACFGTVGVVTSRLGPQAPDDRPAAPAPVVSSTSTSSSASGVQEHSSSSDAGVSPASAADFAGTWVDQAGNSFALSAQADGSLLKADDAKVFIVETGGARFVERDPHGVVPQTLSLRDGELEWALPEPGKDSTVLQLHRLEEDGQTP